MYTEFNKTPQKIKNICIECGMPENNHMAYHKFNSGIKENLTIEKCKCIPSGLCHSFNPTGCNHNHYYKNNIWTCSTFKKN